MATKELKKKFDLILSREQRMARAIALKAIRPKPLSVWEVMVPVIFIMGYMRAKADREVFSQNLMFTKKKALDAAFEMLHRDRPKEAVMGRVASETESLLVSVPDGMYSDAIRQQQIKEIDLLLDHYCRLMRAKGKEYAALVLNTYPTKAEFVAFQDKLTVAEHKVTQAARETLGQQTDDQMAARIETAFKKFRRQEIETIYSTP